MSLRPLPGRARFALAGMMSAVASASFPADAAQTDASFAVAAAHPYAGHVSEAARRFGLPESWIWAVMRAESRGDRRATSPVGATGLMQIMPVTWATLTARYGLGSDPYEVRANIHAGAAYLREMLDRYGDLGTALAAYNAGPGRVDDWRAGTRGLPAATRVYVDRITASVGIAETAPAGGTQFRPPVTWRDAALFVARDDGVSADTAVSASAQPIDNIAASARLLSAQQRSPVNPLFIPLSGRSAP